MERYVGEEDYEYMRATRWMGTRVAGVCSTTGICVCSTYPIEELDILPYDSLIEEGRYAGGHGLMLHAEGTTQLWAVPPEVIAVLGGMLPNDQHRTLLSRTPGLSTLAGR